MRSLGRAAALLCLLLLLAAPSLAAAQGFQLNTNNFSIGSGPGGFGIATKNFSFGVGSGFGPAGCSFTICGVGGTILYIINFVLVPVLFAVAFIMFLWGVAQAYIFSHGDPAKVATGHKLILWGVVGFVVMLSLWGLVNVVSSTFGLSGYSAPPTPTSF